MGDDQKKGGEYQATNNTSGPSLGGNNATQNNSSTVAGSPLSADDELDLLFGAGDQSSDKSSDNGESDSDNGEGDKGDDSGSEVQDEEDYLVDGVDGSIEQTPSDQQSGQATDDSVSHSSKQSIGDDISKRQSSRDLNPLNQSGITDNSPSQENKSGSPADKGLASNSSSELNPNIDRELFPYAAGGDLAGQNKANKTGKSGGTGGGGTGDGESGAQSGVGKSSDGVGAEAAANRFKNSVGGKMLGGNKEGSAANKIMGAAKGVDDVASTAKDIRNALAASKGNIYLGAIQAAKIIWKNREKLKKLLVPLLALYAFQLIVLFLIIGSLFVGGDDGSGRRPSAGYTVVSYANVTLPTDFDKNMILSNEFFDANGVLGNKESSIATIQDILDTAGGTLGKIKVDPGEQDIWGTWAYKDEACTQPKYHNAAEIIYAASTETVTVRLPFEPNKTQTVQIKVNPLIIMAELEKEQTLLSVKTAETSNDFKGRMRKSTTYGYFTRYSGFANQTMFTAAGFTVMMQKARNGIVFDQDDFGNNLRINEMFIPRHSNSPSSLENRIRPANAATVVLYAHNPSIDAMQDLFSILKSKRHLGIYVNHIRTEVTDSSGISPICDANGKCLLKVPYVQQTEKMCGAASASMVNLYYNQKFMNIKWQNTAAGKEWLTYDASKGVLVTKTHSGISLAGILQAGKVPGYRAVTDLNASTKDKAIKAIKKSINGGYPVIVYTNHLNHAHHIMVVVGYDNSTFYVNDPQPQGDAPLKWTNVIAVNQNKKYTHSALVESMYINQQFTNNMLIYRSFY